MWPRCWGVRPFSWPSKWPPSTDKEGGEELCFYIGARRGGRRPISLCSTAPTAVNEVRVAVVKIFVRLSPSRERSLSLSHICVRAHRNNYPWWFFHFFFKWLVTTEFFLYITWQNILDSTRKICIKTLIHYPQFWSGHLLFPRDKLIVFRSWWWRKRFLLYYQEEWRHFRAALRYIINWRNI